MNFEALNLTTPLLNALKDQGLEQPTTIQHKVFPVAMSGKDLLGIAQTGTGKTLAYLLPCLRLWKFNKDPNPHILILVPTRELVVQVVEEVKKLTSYMNIVVTGVYGGANINTQTATVLQGLDILVGTPGRTLDLALNGAFKMKAIKKLVIDEVDEMLQLGFRSQLNSIFDLLPDKRQNLLFSATLSPEVETLINAFTIQAEKIEAAPAGTPLKNIHQSTYAVPNFYTKVNLLHWLMDKEDSMKKVLVFTASKRLADLLFTEIEHRYPEQIGVIHSNKAQNHRFNSVEQFRNGNYRVLIATDLVARGLDIMGVSHVLNFDLPEIPENYIHRIGRTGRAEEKGIAISFITEKDNAAKLAIENLMKMPLDLKLLPDEVNIETHLTEYEQPKAFTGSTYTKSKKKVSAGPAFHEKKSKNLKVNSKVSHNEKMKLKYKKPKKRGSKGK